MPLEQGRSMMEAALAKVAEMQPPANRFRSRGVARKSRQQTEEVVRYFLAKEGSSVEKPELGVEVPSEGEALIKAFQSKNGVIYTLLAYKAEAEMQEGSPTLVKRPIRK
jgi:hypothetical protein